MKMSITKSLSWGLHTTKILLAVGLLAFGFLTIPTHKADANVSNSTLVAQTNQYRASNGLPALTVNPKLTYSAQLKAADMAKYGYFAHTSPQGVRPWSFFASAGYTYVSAGENLAVDFNDSSSLMNAWMKSPTHRANILGSQFTEIGIATVSGTYQGRPTIFVVQHFGKPKGAIAKATTTPVQTAPKADSVQTVALSSRPVTVAPKSVVTVAKQTTPVKKTVQTSTVKQTAATPVKVATANKPLTTINSNRGSIVYFSRPQTNAQVLGAQDVRTGKDVFAMNVTYAALAFAGVVMTQNVWKLAQKKA